MFTVSQATRGACIVTLSYLSLAKDFVVLDECNVQPGEGSLDVQETTIHPCSPFQDQVATKVLLEQMAHGPRG